MTTFLTTHLWQSTLFVGVAALVALVLRNNPARMRYLIWLTASVKFLVPFAALVALGRQVSPLLPRRADALPGPALALIETAVEPFGLPDLPAAAIASASSVPSEAGLSVVSVVLMIWIVGVLLIAGAWATRWRTVRRLVRAAAPMIQGREANIFRTVTRARGVSHVRLMASDGSLEPGVVGCSQAVILWPRHISSRMTDEQIAAILLHELAHVQRHDNVLALVHMAVQALFWFHPLVWWIGARLVDERERACDEEVVRHGADPHQYAESILRTCEYAMESPLVCVAGVTGADLKRRVIAIIRNRPAGPLGGFKVALLVIVAAVFAGGPIAAGAVTRTTTARPAVITAVAQPATAGGRPAPALKFEVASVKLLEGGNGPVAVRIGPQGNYFRHAGSIRLLIQQAYQVPFVRQLGGPEWIREDNYRINAKIPDEVARTPENTREMVRALLVDRFKLVVREEEREVPIYALTHARADKTLGPKLQPFTIDCQGRDDADCNARLSSRRGAISLRNAAFERFAPMLEFSVGRPVVDRTALTGRFNIDLAYAPDEVVAAGGSDLPSLFTALQEQLGLKLESERASMPMVIIERIERPAED